MAKLETVARLLGHSIAWAEGETFYSHRVNGEHKGWCESPMPYDTDANASRELLAYTDKAYMALSFLVQLRKQVWPDLPPSEWESRSDHGVDSFRLLNAPPQQIYDAFCATFACELEQVEKQSCTKPTR